MLAECALRQSLPTRRIIQPQTSNPAGPFPRKTRHGREQEKWSEDMGDVCGMCHDTVDLGEWKHPGSGESLQLCRYCRESVIGVCSRCGELLVKHDRYGVEGDGSYICSRCAQVLEDGD